MKQPKFKVGEEVILVSEKYPHNSGEYIIQDIIKGNEKLECRVTGKLCSARGAKEGEFLLSND